MKKRLERRSLLLLFLLLIFCVAASIQINEKAKKNRLNLKTGSTEEFRKLGMEVQLFGMISAIFLFRNHRNIHSIRYLLWTAGWESAPTEEKGDMKAVI